MKAIVVAVVTLVAITAVLNSHLVFGDCSNFQGQDMCQGNQTDEPDIRNLRRWQTPPRNDSTWLSTYQDYNSLVGYAQVQYDSSHTAAIVTVYTLTKENSTKLSFSFNGRPATDVNFIKLDSSFTDPVQIVVTASSGARLELDDVDLLWNNPEVKQGPQYLNGQKGAIVELFGWPYTDIAAECDAIAKMGYMGVKVFPPQESVMSFEWLQNGELNPWYFIYQPVSYRLHGRSGTRQQLRDMVVACRKAGVRVYADAVTNHMSGGGNDVGPHRNSAGSSCAYWGGKTSSAGSPYYTQDFAYELNNFTGQHPGQEYPAVPYGPLDFHCERVLGDWSSGFSLNYGWLVGLTDLNTERPYVQQRIADYLTDLLGIGFSGVRIDAAKHIQPDDLAAIFGKLRTNLGGVIPADFIAYLEVIIGGEKDLLECSYNYYDYALYFSDALAKNGLSADDIAKIKIWESDYPKEFPICGQWIIPSERFAIQNDCADDQNPGSSSRDMGSQGSVLIRDKNVPLHRSFEQQLFTRTDGNWQIRLVLSSYTYMNSGAAGFPDGLSDCVKCTGQFCAQCKTVPYQAAHDPNVCGYTVFDQSGGWGEGLYTRVHRDKAIIMAMRQWMGLSTQVANAQIGLPDSCQ